MGVWAACQRVSLKRIEQPGPAITRKVHIARRNRRILSLPRGVDGSLRYSSRERLSAGAMVSQDRMLPPRPWTISRGGPAPMRSKCKAMLTQRRRGGGGST